MNGTFDALTDFNWALHPHLIQGCDALHIQNRHPFLSLEYLVTYGDERVS